MDAVEIKKRKYTGPAKGSEQAKERMAKVRAAQWAKNGLVVSSAPANNGAFVTTDRNPAFVRANRGAKHQD